MNRFLELIENPAGMTAADRPMLEEEAGRRPWFALPKLLLLRGTEGEAAGRLRGALALRLMWYPAPPLLLAAPEWSAWRQKGSRELIDDFLQIEGDKRIVADDAPAAADDLSRSADGELPASEALAEIYAAQGLGERAVAIYRRLSLKFPEKSVYFADRIAELNPKK